MHRSRHHVLLGRIHLLQLRHGDVDAAFQCILVHAEVAVDSSRPFPLIRNKSLNLGALVTKKNGDGELEFP